MSRWHKFDTRVCVEVAVIEFAADYKSASPLHHKKTPSGRRIPVPFERKHRAEMQYLCFLTFRNDNVEYVEVVNNIMSIGMKRGILKLEPYDPEWVVFFDDEKNKIRNTIGQSILTIEHIGSTSIKSMCAKPIIDIAIGLEKYDDGFKCVEPLKSIGYLFLGELGRPKRHYFRTDSDTVKCHIHMYEISNEDYLNHILFRDYLRNHVEEARKYAALKKNLLQECGNDREKYTEGKAEFINGVLQKARKAKEDNKHAIR